VFVWSGVALGESGKVNGNGPSALSANSGNASAEAVRLKAAIR
jgi:hypothetical protein